METPSSVSMVTKSYPSAASQKKEPSSHSKPDRSALVDITNDSPIVGLAAGSLKTPNSSAVKKGRGARPPARTPGSGEAILRGQVKTLLQKVEEESELVKLPNDEVPDVAPFRMLLGHLRSPAGLLAPTPANTPLFLGLPVSTADDEMVKMMMMESVHEENHLGIPQVSVVAGVSEEECQVNRALLFDSPEKSDNSDASSVSSALTYQGSTTACCFGYKSTDEDCSSAWSIQANASSRKEGEQNEAEEEGFDEEDEEEEYEGGGSVLDDLCDGLSRMSVLEKKGLPEFAGKHTRFVYNSEDEMEGEEEEVRGFSPNVVLLKGLPMPEGKHLRFQEEEEEKEEEA